LFIGAPPAVNDAGCVFYLGWQCYFRYSLRRLLLPRRLSTAGKTAA